jgi:hypothetical protein
MSHAISSAIVRFKSSTRLSMLAAVVLSTHVGCVPAANEEHPLDASDLVVGDAGVPPRDDAGSENDGGSLVDDAGALLDAGHSEDAGHAFDAGHALDAGALAPFAPQPDDSEGLTNVDVDLAAVLEHGALEGACDAYAASPTDRQKKLLCGKSMFFYEGFDTVGVPAALLDFFGTKFESSLGLAYQGLGMIPDPTSEQGRPLGVGRGAPLGTIETLAFTCASCHFGKLDDGRYAVGAPNHDYDYGGQILAILIAPNRVAPGFDPADVHPDAVLKIAPVLEALDASFALRIELLMNVLPLAGAADGAPMVGVEDQGHYAHWLTGTMDFLMAPLPVDDEVHTVSKILALYGIPRAAEEEVFGMPHGMLAWTGGADSLHTFLEGFVAIGEGAEDAWPHERLDPLAEYIYSLRAPVPLSPAPDALVDEGRGLFDSRGCIDCHDGPRGGGRRVFTFEEIGTDDAMRAWGDPTLSGSLCCGLGDPDTVLTHGIKSPRLTGSSSFKRFLHNGSISSLEELLCRDGPRDLVTAYAYGNQGHEFGCDLEASEKDALLAFLRSL